MSTSSGHGEERIKKLLDQFLVCRDRWQSIVNEGKVTLDSILSKIKVTEEVNVQKFLKPKKNNQITLIILGPSLRS
jgi:hypothetical protein